MGTRFVKNDTRVKVLISYASGHVEVRSPQEKKSIAIIKNMALKQWKAAVANAIFDHAELREELPEALKRIVSAEFREYCRSDSLLKGTDPDQLSSFSNHLVLREIAIFCPLWNACVTGAACGERKNVTNPIALSMAVVARCRNPLMSAVAYRISMILFHSAARHVDFQQQNRLGICMSASMTVALQRKMGANYDCKVLAWKKEIEKNKASIRLLEEIKRDQVTQHTNGIASEDVSIDIRQPKLRSYSSYDEETGQHVLRLFEEVKKQNPHLTGISNAHLNTVLSDLQSQKLPVFKLVNKISLLLI